MATEKSVTVTELKTFIDAVEFAADTEEWIPSARQWTRIRSMIDRLVEASAPAPAPAPERYVESRQPISYAQGGLTGGPPQVGMQGPPMMPPQMMPQTPQPPLAGPFAQGSAAPVRTPDLDTSHGRPYQSAFAG